MKKGQIMPEHIRDKIRLSKRGKSNGRLGYKHSKKTIEKIRLSKIGVKNPMYGNTIGHPHSEETKKVLSDLLKKRYESGFNPRKGLKHTSASRKKMRESHIGKKLSDSTRKKLSECRCKKKHWNWKADRTLLKQSEKKHLCAKYKEWSSGVKNRDNWTCRLKNETCKGRLEAHHIFNWIEYPHLRYKIKNGITLCHAHHPRGRSEEKRLENLFIKLVSESKV